MTTKKLNNEEIIIESDGLVRIAIMDGDIAINNENGLPKGKLLYYMDRVIISGNGNIKYN